MYADAHAVQHPREPQREHRVAWHVEGLEGGTRVLHEVAVDEDAVDADRLGQQARQVEASRLGDDPGERVVDPGLGAVFALEPRDAGEVVVVVVARDGGADAPQAGLGAELVERVGDEPLVGEEVVPRREPVVEDEGVAVVVDRA